MDKSSFILYREYEEMVSALTDEQAGQLLRAIFAYTARGEEAELEPVARVAFIAIRQQLDRDREKYELRCAAGKAGGAPQGNCNAQRSRGAEQGASCEKQAKTSKNNQRQAKSSKNKQKQAYNDNENDNESVSVTVVAVATPVTESVESVAGAAGGEGEDVEQVIESWAEAVGREPTPGERRRLKEQLRQYGVERTLYAIDQAVLAGVCKLSYVCAVLDGHPRGPGPGREIRGGPEAEQYQCAMAALQEIEDRAYKGG